MRLSAVREGDLVLADVRGRRFLAHVDGPPCGGEVPVTPLNGVDSYRLLTARQVVSHYQRRGGTADQVRYIAGAARRRAAVRQRPRVPA